MSIVAVGTDLVAVARIRRTLESHGERFARRVLTPGERQDVEACPDPAAFLARRFAAKEAAAKALGTGIAAGVGFQDMEIDHDSRGAPRLGLSGGAACRSEDLGVTRIHLSISDERDYAVAFVVLEGD